MQIIDFLNINPLTDIEKIIYLQIQVLSTKIASAHKINSHTVVHLLLSLDKLYTATTEERREAIVSARNFVAQTYHPHLVIGYYFQILGETGLPPMCYEYGGNKYVNGIPTGMKLGVEEPTEKPVEMES